MYFQLMFLTLSLISGRGAPYGHCVWCGFVVVFVQLGRKSICIILRSMLSTWGAPYG